MKNSKIALQMELKSSPRKKIVDVSLAKWFATAYLKTIAKPELFANGIRQYRYIEWENDY